MIELTPETTARYLRDRGWIGAAEPVAVEAMAWGVSNLVLRVRAGGRLLVLKQSRPQLRTREAWFSDLDRVFREVEVMRLLAPRLPPGTVPEVLFVDREQYLFAMSHAPEDAAVWKGTLLAGQADPAVARRAGTLLGLIHEQTAGLPAPESELADLDDRTVFVQLRVDPFYQRIRERRPEVAGPVSQLIEELATVRQALCHGDFSPKNLLVSPGGAITLVDYETGHFGDPALDLGFFLSHLVLKSIRHAGRLGEYLALTQAFWESYGAAARFRPLAELVRRGIRHLAVCILARIDGTSPVDYLPEEEKREAVRRIGRRLLLAPPSGWEEVSSIVAQEGG